MQGTKFLILQLNTLVHYVMLISRSINSPLVIFSSVDDSVVTCSVAVGTT